MEGLQATTINLNDDSTVVSSCSEGTNQVQSKVDEQLDNVSPTCQLFPEDLSKEAQEKFVWVNNIRKARAANNKELEKALIQEAAAALKCHPGSVPRLVNNVAKKGLIALERSRRSDKGKPRYVSEAWRRLVIELYKRGQQYARRISRHGIWLLVLAVINKFDRLPNTSNETVDTFFKGIADRFDPDSKSDNTSIRKILKEIRKEVKSGKFEPPKSHTTVYEIIDSYLEEEAKSVRHIGQGLPRVVKTLSGDIVVDYSNKVLEIDETPSDILLLDEEGNEIGCPFFVLAVEGMGGCVAGFHLGLKKPTSHEMALAYRHAVLPKHYGPEYKLQKEWNICGEVEYVVTDRAKVFKSDHLDQVAEERKFIRDFRAFPSQGGQVETVFDKFNKQFHSWLNGYKGSNVQERPKNAEKWACYKIDELERLIVRFIVDHWNQSDYPRLPDQLRCERWDLMLVEPPKIPQERELDICLLKHRRNNPLVHRYGEIYFEGKIYKSESLLKYKGKRIAVRFDSSNIINILVYTVAEDGKPGEFIGVVRARDLKEDKLSLKELKERHSRSGSKRRARDRSSTEEERLDLFGSGESKAKQTRKTRRNQEHDLKGRSSALGNVVEFKRQEESTSKNADNTASDPGSQTEDAPPIPRQRKRYTPAEFTGVVVNNVDYWNQ